MKEETIFDKVMKMRANNPESIEVARDLISSESEQLFLQNQNYASMLDAKISLSAYLATKDLTKQSVFLSIKDKIDLLTPEVRANQAYHQTKGLKARLFSPTIIVAPSTDENQNIYCAYAKKAMQSILLNAQYEQLLKKKLPYLDKLFADLIKYVPNQKDITELKDMLMITNKDHKKNKVPNLSIKINDFTSKFAKCSSKILKVEMPSREKNAAKTIV
ncbi:MAG: hypothetical protein JO131_02200, partial [Gammaproteobacteria bacterium]|nr:hypothetical protein [Gammaproteobacteria bacterium]